MKLKKYAALIGALALVLLLTGCPGMFGGNKCTITFLDSDGVTVLETISCIKGDIIPFPNPEKEGWHFFGWYDESGSFYYSKKATGDAVFIAKWWLIVSFNAMGGKISSVVDYEYVTPGETISRFPIPEKPTCSFKGWTKDPYGEVIEFVDETSIFTEPTTLYAIWHDGFENGGKRSSEYLVLMYLDGDNNLTEPIFHDLNEVESGLENISSKNIRVVALWDGYADLKSTYKIPGNTVLFELGPDSMRNEMSLSAKSVNFTDIAPFIRNQNYEVDMGDKQTLIDFLNWAMQHYEANHIILTFSDHGGGPRSRPTGWITLDDGRLVKVSDDSSRRSMCWDDSAKGEKFLSTKDVAEALDACGFGEDEGKIKLDMIVEDVCLGGSIEEAYELRNFADYYVGSPNNVPGTGLYYYEFIQMLSVCQGNIKNFGSRLVKDYSSRNALGYNYWKQCADYVVDYYTKTGYLKPSDNDYQDKMVKLWIELLTTNQDACTLTCVDLSKVEAVKDAVRSLSNVLIAGANKKYPGLYVTVDGKITDTETSRPLLYNELLQLCYLENYGALCYTGTFSHLFDLGYVALGMKNESVYSDAAWPELNTASESVLSSLKSAIVSSWRDGFKIDKYQSSTQGYYYSMPYGIYSLYDSYSGSSANDSRWFGSDSAYMGLTICGGWNYLRDTETGNLYMYNEPLIDWYDSKLSFGRDSRWGDVLELFFGN